jgi:drug/metabolite transporter (DMT)-like permease
MDGAYPRDSSARGLPSPGSGDFHSSTAYCFRPVPPQHSNSGPSFATVGIFTILFTLIGWASVPLFLKHFSYAIDAWTSNGWRYGFSALLWLPVVVIGVWARNLPAGLWRAAVIPSIFNAAGQIAFTWGHYKIDPGLLSFGLRAHIIFVTIGAALFFASERRIIWSPGFMIGLGMVAGGTAGTIILGEGFGEQATVFGVTLAILAGLLFACYALSVRYYMRGINAIVAFAAISQYTAGAMIVLMLILGDRMGAAALDLGGGQFALLLISAVIGIALGHVFYYMSINRLGVAVSSGVIQLQPFLVVTGSFFLFGEKLTHWQLLSGMIAIAGAAVILSVQHRRSQDHAIPPLAAAVDAAPDRVDAR